MLHYSVPVNVNSTSMKKKAERQHLSKQKDLLIQRLAYKRKEPSSNSKYWRGRLFCSLLLFWKTDLYDGEDSQKSKRFFGERPTAYMPSWLNLFKHLSNTSRQNCHIHMDVQLLKLDKNVPAWHYLLHHAFLYISFVPLLSHFLIIHINHKTNNITMQKNVKTM